MECDAQVVHDDVVWPQKERDVFGVQPRWQRADQRFGRHRRRGTLSHCAGACSTSNGHALFGCVHSNRHTPRLLLLVFVFCQPSLACVGLGRVVGERSLPIARPQGSSDRRGDFGALAAHRDEQQGRFGENVGNRNAALCRGTLTWCIAAVTLHAIRHWWAIVPRCGAWPSTTTRREW